MGDGFTLYNFTICQWIGLEQLNRLLECSNTLKEDKASSLSSRGSSLEVCYATRGLQKKIREIVSHLWSYALKQTQKKNRKQNCASCPFMALPLSKIEKTKNKTEPSSPFIFPLNQNRKNKAQSPTLASLFAHIGQVFTPSKKTRIMLTLT